MAERAVTIARPLEEVFACPADGPNDPQWRPADFEITEHAPARPSRRCDLTPEGA